MLNGKDRKSGCWAEGPGLLTLQRSAGPTWTYRCGDTREDVWGPQNSAGKAPGRWQEEAGAVPWVPRPAPKPDSPHHPYLRLPAWQPRGRHNPHNTRLSHRQPAPDAQTRQRPSEPVSPRLLHHSPPHPIAAFQNLLPPHSLSGPESY